MPDSQGTLIVSQTPLEQLNITQDETEYLFYYTSNVSLGPGSNVTIAGRMANSYSLYIGGRLVANAFDDNHYMGASSQTLMIPSSFAKGVYSLAILSGSLGLQNWFPNLIVTQADQEKKGIVGSVTVDGVDVTANGWQHRPFLTGELLQVYTESGASAVTWTPTTGAGVATALTWFKTSFAAPPASPGKTLLLNLGGAGRGHIYLNGVDMGRYASAFSPLVRLFHALVAATG